MAQAAATGASPDMDSSATPVVIPTIKLRLNVTLPGMLELHRIAIRGLITKKNEKNYFVIPTYDIILKKMLDYEFKKLNLLTTASVSESSSPDLPSFVYRNGRPFHYRVHDSSDILTEITLNIGKQEEIGRLIWPELKKKTLKRKYGDEFEQASLAAAAKEESEWGVGENLNRATIGKFRPFSQLSYPFFISPF